MLVLYLALVTAVIISSDSGRETVVKWVKAVLRVSALKWMNRSLHLVSQAAEGSFSSTVPVVETWV